MFIEGTFVIHSFIPSTKVQILISSGEAEMQIVFLQIHLFDESTVELYNTDVLLTKM